MAEIRKIGTGFDVVEFKDRGGNKCSLQKSSTAIEDCVWLGCDEIGLRKFTPGPGWENISTANEGGAIGGITYIANNRMHLNQEQVAAILPYLQRFVETGEL